MMANKWDEWKNKYIIHQGYIQFYKGGYNFL